MVHFRHIFRIFRHISLPKSAIFIELMLNLDIYFSILQHIYGRICQDYKQTQRKGMTPQTTPSYARGYVRLLWGSLGYPKYGRKTSPYFFGVFICKFIKDFIKKFYSPLLFWYKKSLAFIFFMYYNVISGAIRNQSTKY